MTRRQVKAAMRRLREAAEEAEEETGEINLVPYMDIVTNIIIFLLAVSVTQVPLGNINASAPTIGVGGGDSSQPEKPPLNLTITIGANSFIVAGGGGVIPPVPKLANGQYDFDGLTSKLAEIKKIEPTETKATLSADAWIPYEII